MLYAVITIMATSTLLIKHNLRCAPLLERKEEPKCDANLCSAVLDLLLESLFYKILARIILTLLREIKSFVNASFFDSHCFHCLWEQILIFSLFFNSLLHPPI